MAEFSVPKLQRKAYPCNTRRRGGYRGADSGTESAAGLPEGGWPNPRPFRNSLAVSFPCFSLLQFLLRIHVV